MSALADATAQAAERLDALSGYLETAEVLRFQDILAHLTTVEQVAEFRRVLETEAMNGMMAQESAIAEAMGYGEIPDDA